MLRDHCSHCRAAADRDYCRTDLRWEQRTQHQAWAAGSQEAQDLHTPRRQEEHSSRLLVSREKGAAQAEHSLLDSASSRLLSSLFSWSDRSVWEPWTSLKQRNTD